MTSVFLASAALATDPAASAVRIRIEDANVLTHVSSHMRQRPREQGYTVISSSSFPSPGSRPDGSSMDGIPTAERPRRTTSIWAELPGMRPTLKRHDKVCAPTASTVVPHLMRNTDSESDAESDADTESIVVDESAHSAA